jgi:hypothetical protein
MHWSSVNGSLDDERRLHNIALAQGIHMQANVYMSEREYAHFKVGDFEGSNQIKSIQARLDGYTTSSAICCASRLYCCSFNGVTTASLTALFPVPALMK